MNKALESIIDNIYSIKDKKDLENFLLGLLTPKEIVEFSQRIEIIKMLKGKFSQKKIAQTLGVGIATVTRGSKELQQGRFKNV